MAIKIKGSSTAGAVPASLENRQLAVNTTDKKLFVGDGTAVQTLIGTIASQDANNVNITGGTIANVSLQDILPVQTNVSYTEFTSSGTWTKPGNATFVMVECWGAGAGGSAGNVSNAPGGELGGTGGGGGAYTMRLFAAADLTSTVSVTVGAGGTGGIAPSGNGSSGGNTTFGSYLISYGAQGHGIGAGVLSSSGYPQGTGDAPSVGLTISGQFGGGGVNSKSIASDGNTTAASGWGGGGGGSGNPSLGFSKGLGGGSSFQGGAGGGGGGFYQNSSATLRTGGDGGSISGSSYGGGAAGTSGSLNGSAGSTRRFGGGGGYPSISGVAGSGGAGGLAAGGGGGAHSVTGTAGNGGAGGNGFCRVYTW